VLLLLLLYRCVVLLQGPEGDFINHREFGGRVLTGVPIYEGGLNNPYPPLWATVHAPLALLPLGPAFVVYTAISLLALAALTSMLLRQLRHLEFDSVPGVALVVFLLVVARPFLLRDFMDGGPNTIILALTWGGVYCWSNGRDTVGGICLGLATALKCTPVLFLLYFAWKRQSRMALTMLVATVAFTLLPAVTTGPTAYVREMRIWTHNILRAAEPGWSLIGPEELRNCSLRASLGRLLVELPAGHPGRLEHPWRVQLARRSPDAAQLIICATMLALVGALAWSCRRAVRRRDSEEVCAECAAVALAMPLLSPITWGHHCVVVIPALALLMCRAVRDGSRGLTMGLSAVTLFYVVGQNRTVTGPITGAIFAYYAAIPLSLLLLMVLLFTRPAPAPALPSESHSA
jgi:hypothetical protein